MTTRMVAVVMRAAVAPVAAAALGGLLAGCGDDRGVDEAETDYCDATDEVQAAFERLARMDSDNSAEELSDARDDLADALGHLEDASTDVAQARDQAGDDPITAFNERVQDIDDDASLTEIGSEMARAGGEFVADVKQYLDDLECRER
jgi:hypothetical protein